MRFLSSQAWGLFQVYSLSLKCQPHHPQAKPGKKKKKKLENKPTKKQHIGNIWWDFAQSYSDSQLS